MHDLIDLDHILERNDKKYAVISFRTKVLWNVTCILARRKTVIPVKGRRETRRIWAFVNCMY